MQTADGFRVALFSALVVIGAWASYWPRIKAHRVPRRPIGYQVVMIAGSLLAMFSLSRGTGPACTTLAGVALLGATCFLFSILTSAVPAKVPAVHVGGRMLPFQAKDQDGADFDSASLAGSPVLLKFYRGHW